MQYKDAVEVVQFNVDVVPCICFWSWKHLLSLFLHSNRSPDTVNLVVSATKVCLSEFLVLL